MPCSRTAAPRRTAVVAALVALAPLAACGEGGEARPEPDVPEATPRPVEPLSDDDLAGLDARDVVINLSWVEGTVSRDPAPAAPRATVLDVSLGEHEAFDRLVMEIGPEAPFPGYRVARADPATLECGDAGPEREEGPLPVVVRLQPAQAHTDEGTPTVTETTRPTDFPGISSARQACDEGAVVVWLLEASDSTAFRVIEMRDPPRLVVDVAHPGATLEAPAPAADTAAGAGSGG